MITRHIKLNLGLAILVFFTINGQSRGAALPIGLTRSFFFLPVTFQSAPAQQDTAYPYPPAETATEPGYPEPDTPTSPAGYPEPETATSPALNPTGTTSPSPTQVTLTPLPTDTAASDIYLTENAEMGQSRATPLPSETPSPSATVTTTLLPSPTPLAIPPDQEEFRMNWIIFFMSFFGMMGLSCAAWFMFLKKLMMNRG